MANQELDNAALLRVEIRPDELSTLLERLAATEAMYGEPASTIRDVAELTEASPNLIARLLADIRGDDEFRKLQQKVESHDNRIEAVEYRVNHSLYSPPAPMQNYYQFDQQQPQTNRETNHVVSLIVFVIIALIMFGMFQAGTAKMDQQRQDFMDRHGFNQWPSIQDSGSSRSNDGTIFMRDENIRRR